MSEWEGVSIEVLEAEICTSAAHLAAAECRLLLLIAEFDRREGAAGWGLASTAHFLNWKCSMALGAAREHVRVGRRLEELALIREAYARGELSYSKVRALTRVASAADEAELLMLAGHLTAEHLERLCRAYRRAGAGGGGEVAASDRHRRRYLSSGWDDDGCMVLRARLSPEEGAVVSAALRLVQDQLRSDAEGAATEVAEAADDGWGASLADALAAMAASVLSGQSGQRRPASGADCYQVVVHADARALDASGAAGAGAGAEAAHLEDGPALGGETLRRLCCDTKLVLMVDGPEGTPVATGPRTRTISAALRRALRARDGGCVFPGCTHRAFVDAHHIEHWCEGGATTLANLCELCRLHHRLVHEAGWAMEVVGPSRFLFYRPDGTPMSAPGLRVPSGDRAIRDANAAVGIVPTPASLEPDWDGRAPDYAYIVDCLLAQLEVVDVPAGTSDLESQLAGVPAGTFEAVGP